MDILNFQFAKNLESWVTRYDNRVESILEKGSHSFLREDWKSKYARTISEVPRAGTYMAFSFLDIGLLVPWVVEISDIQLRGCCSIESGAWLTSALYVDRAASSPEMAWRPP